MAAAQQLRRAGPSRRPVRARRGRRRARALRRAGLQDREADRRAARAAARRRGRRAALRRRRRRRRDRRRAARRVRRRRADDRLARAARPAGPGPRARGHPLRDGLPLRAQPLGRDAARPGADRRRARARRHHRGRQARRRRRRRRHRRGLRRQLDPRGRAVGHAARAAARAARATAPTTARRGRCGRTKFRLSYAMEEAQGVGKGEQDFSVVTTHFSGVDGRVAAQHIAQAEPAPPFGAGRGHRARAEGRPRAAGDGLPAPEQEGIVEQLGCELDPRGNVRARDLRDVRPRRVRRRRRAPRPVADRLGDQRGPPVRADGRSPSGRAATRS